MTTINPREQLDLSGPWQLAFDPAGEGIGGDWTGSNWPEARSDWVQVPALWNITHPDAEGVGFYRRVFAVPPDWGGKVSWLRFGGASYRAEVWLNGAYVGSHEGAYAPFCFDVTPSLRVGTENQLVVRVASLSKTQDVDGMVLQESPASKQSWYYTHGGLWGQVTLEARPPISCGSLVVEPDLHRETVAVEVAVHNGHVESGPAELHLEIARPDRSLAAETRSRVTLPPGTHRLTYRLSVPRPLLWHCDHPHLYQLRVGVSGGKEPVDRQAVSFGVREFTVRDGQFFLNGEPIFLRGLLLQPHYPVTLVTPPNREMMVREVRLAKEGGFNLIRTHIRPAPPGYLDLTDEMGLLVYAEACLAWIKESPRLLDHGRRELQAAIERDRNHPSVVFWGIYNENRAASALTSEALIRFVRALDPTRVIVDNSGGSMAIDQDFGWADRTMVVPSRETARQRIQDLHIYVGAPLTPPVYEWLRTLGVSDPAVDMSAHDFGSKAIVEEWQRELRSYRGQVFVSELGCGGMADLDEVLAEYGEQGHLRDAREMKAFRDSLHQGFEARRLGRVFGSVRQLIQATQAQQAAGLKRQVEALLVNHRVSGYVVTQINDVAWEFHAGVLDPWRQPKPAYEALKRLNRPHCVVPKAARPVVSAGDRVDVAITLVSQHPLPGEAQIHVTAHDPEGREVETRQQRPPSGTGIHEMGAISIQTGRTPGEYQVRARLVSDGETIAASAETILSLPPVDLAEAVADVRFVGQVPAAFGAAARGETGSGRGAGTAEGGPALLLAADPASLSEGDWQDLLEMVEAGRVAIVGPLHRRDQTAQRRLKERGVNLELHLGIGNWMGCYHWIPDSDLFAGLPAPGLASEAYAEVLPWYVLSEMDGDILAGSLRNTQTRREPPAMLWYSDVEAVRLGKGTLFLCQYRAFEPAAENPLAARLVYNLIRLARGYL